VNQETLEMIQELSEMDLLEQVGDFHCLRHFEDIRKTVLVDNSIRVTGAMDMTLLSQADREKAAPFAHEGFVYGIEDYSFLSGTLTFTQRTFGFDPWL